MPLQLQKVQEESDRIYRLKNPRIRPRQVKFNTNLMSPVLQRGLERWYSGHEILP